MQRRGKNRYTEHHDQHLLRRSALPQHSNSALSYELLLSAPRSCSCSTLCVKLLTLSSGITTRHLLLGLVLHTIHTNKCKETIQMPRLPFNRNVICNHPVMNDLSSDNFAVARSTWMISESSSRLFTVNVLVDVIEVLLRQVEKNLRRNIRSQCHGLNVPQRFFASLFF